MDPQDSQLSRPATKAFCALMITMDVPGLGFAHRELLITPADSRFRGNDIVWGQDFSNIAVGLGCWKNPIPSRVPS